MLISHSKKFLFFHLIKTGGKSITKALAEYINIDINRSNGKSQIDADIIELMENMGSALNSCSIYDDLAVEQKAAIKYVYDYLTKNLDPKTDLSLSLDYTMASPKIFYSIFMAFINENYPKIYSTVHEHQNARIGKKILPVDIFNNYFKFAFVRHPLDWLVSIYFFFSQYENEIFHKDFQKFKNFNEFINAFITMGKENFGDLGWFYELDFSLKAPQRDFLYDEQGNLLVDFVGKFENIEDDFAKICKIIGIENVRLPHIDKSRHDNYSNYYTPETKKHIYSILKEDFKTFDYHI